MIIKKFKHYSSDDLVTLENQVITGGMSSFQKEEYLTLIEMAQENLLIKETAQKQIIDLKSQLEEKLKEKNFFAHFCRRAQIETEEYRSRWMKIRTAAKIAVARWEFGNHSEEREAMLKLKESINDYKKIF